MEARSVFCSNSVVTFISVTFPMWVRESVLFMLHKNIRKGHFVNILYMTSVLHYTAGATEEGPLQNPQKMGPSYRVCPSKSRGD